MKNIFKLLTVVLLSIMLYSCEKNELRKVDTPIGGEGAYVKFFNFAINGPSVNFFANDTKLSAILSASGTESPTGVAYGSVFPSTNAYTLIKPGTYDFMSKNPSTATADPNLVISTINQQLVNGKNYSLYTSGLYNTTTKKTDVFIIEDNLPAIDTSSAYARFVHASYNANPFDFIMKNTTTNVETVLATNITYKSASNFIKLPRGTYDLILRYPNTTTNIVVRSGVAINKVNVYTFTLRGDITLPYTGTATNRPFIDNTPNR